MTTRPTAFSSEGAAAAYTFDAFVVSDSSRIAFDAAVAVAENPGRAHNPLFLYGRTGSGKSHLLHAIAHKMRAHRPRANILHLAAETFIARVIDAIRSDEMRAFRESIASVDALFLDDLQLGSDREHTLREIFLRFEELVTHGVQVVAASAAPPVEMRFIEQRSRPLFERALIVEVGYPDRDARVEIARRVARMRGIALSDEVLGYLAARLNGSARKLESVIARIAAESALAGQPLNMTHVARIVSRLEGRPRRTLNN